MVTCDWPPTSLTSETGQYVICVFTFEYCGMDRVALKSATNTDNVSFQKFSALYSGSQKARRAVQGQSRMV